MCRVPGIAALFVLALFGLGIGRVGGQEATESGTVASSPMIATRATKAPSLTIRSAGHQAVPNNLASTTGPAPDEMNRRHFEDNAGRQAGKLLFRSVPAGAEIFINDFLVGRTPMLIFIAPGEYKVNMRGPRQESGQRVVGVTPKQTQTITIDLNQRYPGSVSLRW